MTAPTEIAEQLCNNDITEKVQCIAVDTKGDKKKPKHYDDVDLGQMSLFDTYKSVCASMEEDKPKLFRLLDKHIDWDCLIPARFYMAFYLNTGRPRKYPLVAFLKSLVLQKIFGYVNDSVLLVTLRHSREMRRFCGFSKVPDAAKLTRFKQDFLPYIMEVFERLVELTEPICRAMDAELADCLITTPPGSRAMLQRITPSSFP